MSLPSLPDLGNIPTREEVINLIVSSIAMEELGLSHVINAEGEKLQYALGTIPGVPGLNEPLTMEELLKLNESVKKTLDSTMMNQFLLKEKLISALTSSVMQGPEGPRGPQGPATIDVIRDVDSLEPGNEPYVLNEGTQEDVILKFGIPKGEPGQAGTILGNYDTYQELVSAHPSGKLGDAYLVGGDLYVWNTDNDAWENVGSLQGPQGTGTTIKGTAASKAELDSLHPDGPPEDAYLVNGEIYIWNETDGWHSGGNLTGTGTLIVGTAASKAELDTLHPDGPPEDAYLVGGELYVWDSNPAVGWHSVGNLQGPAGTKLEEDDPLFEVADDQNTEAVQYEGQLTFTSDTLTVSVESGPVVNIENPKPHAGAIIPFASGKAISADTQVVGGGRLNAVLIGFGNAETIGVPVDLTQSITLTGSASANNHMAFPMPASGVITSLAFTASVYALSGIIGVTNVVTARLYRSNTQDNVFLPIEGATASFYMPAVTSGMSYHSAINDTLSIPVETGDRILFLIDTETPDYNSQTLVSAHWCGSIKIEG